MSAGLALAALAIAAVVVLFSILRAPLQSVAALVLVVVATLSAWAALVQRGVMRIAGAVAVVTASAGLVVLLVDVQSLMRAAVLAVLVVPSAATTRAAGACALDGRPSRRRPRR